MDLENLKDKVLICVECGEEFVFTISAQEYFLEKGFTEEPKRCKHCYTNRKKEKRQQLKDAGRRAHTTKTSGSSYNSRTNNRHWPSDSK
jgi:hypothetical protein